MKHEHVDRRNIVRDWQPAASVRVANMRLGLAYPRCRGPGAGRSDVLTQCSWISVRDWLGTSERAYALQDSIVASDRQAPGECQQRLYRPGRRRVRDRA
jgi:hypothetical protein